MAIQAKPLVLFFNPVRHAKAFFEEFRQVAQAQIVTSRTREEFFHDLQGKYNDVFAIYRTPASGAVSIFVS
jgi:glyoxylate reductase